MESMDYRSIKTELEIMEPEQREFFLKSLTDDEVMAFFYDWKGVWARDSQLPPAGDWRTWLILAGRGFG